MVHHLENVRLVIAQILGMDTVGFEFGKTGTHPEDETIDVAYDEMIDLIGSHVEPIAHETPNDAAMHDDSRATFETLDIVAYAPDANEEIVEALPSLRRRPRSRTRTPRKRKISLDDVIEAHALDGPEIELDETLVNLGLEAKLDCRRLGDHRPAAFERRADDAVRTPGDEAGNCTARLLLAKLGHALVSSAEEETPRIRMRLGVPHEEHA